MLGHALSFTLLASAISAALAALLGYFLTLTGDYGGSLTNTHKWLGIALAASTCLVYIIHIKLKTPKYTSWGLVVVSLLLGGTGHYGGMLTHGESYLTGALPADVQNRLGINASTDPQYSFAHIQEAQLYGEVVAPILESRCVSCHNSNKLKGSLLLDSKEGMLEGGENGAVIDLNDPAQSELIKLIHLPVDEDRHMPPRGKKPLTSDELAVLTWWIESGADFQSNVSQLEQDQNIRTALANLETIATREENPVLAQQVNPVKEKTRLKAQQNGVVIKELAGTTNFIEARIEHLNDDLAKTMDGLHSQTIWLSLARSNCTSKDLKSLPKLSNLIKLQLQQTEIDDEAMGYIAKLPYLETLNLYGTQVTDEGLKQLSGLKHLKQVYLWETQVTSKGVESLVNNSPDLVVDLGLTFQDLDSVNLAAPIIEVEKTIFKREVAAKLVTAVEDVQIFYSLDGSDPSVNSILYTGPITINKSCELKAFAVKQGWANSAIASASFLQVKYELSDLKIKDPPADQYAAEGVASLADGQKGSDDFRDGNWLGFNKVDLVADIDLGAITEPQQVVVSCLENLGDYIFYPQALSVEVSNDGFNYRLAKRATFEVPKNYRQPGQKSFALDLKGNQTRYLRIRVRNVGVCPPWHAGSGANAWLFVDEIVVN